MTEYVKKFLCVQRNYFYISKYSKGLSQRHNRILIPSLFQINDMCKERMEYTTASSEQMHARCTFIFLSATCFSTQTCLYLLIYYDYFSRRNYV